MEVMENFVLLRTAIVIIYVPYVHNPASARMILRLDLKREMVVLENLP